MTLTATVNDGDVIASAWGNEIRDRSNQVFASVAERDAQWVAPPNGAQCITLDSNTRWFRRSGVWAAILGGYAVPVVKMTATSGATTAEAVVGGGSISWTADPLKVYRILLTAMMQSSIAGDTAFGRIRQTSSVGPMLAGANIVCAVANFGISYMAQAVVSGFSGAQAAVFTIQRNTGTGSVSNVATTTSPTILSVEDMGFA